MLCRTSLVFLLIPLLSVASWVKDTSNGEWRSESWLVGCNFIPSTAQNELHMFQNDTYDHITIDRELGYAESLGFNAVRVFLHNLLWEDKDVFVSTLESFLQTASSHNIGVMFVLLDSCWNAYPALGPQPDPIPYVHNSVWVQAPGVDIVSDPEKFMGLEDYVTGVIRHFNNDSRIIAWDLWNEPDNSGYTPEQIAPLLSLVFDWARKASPIQPLTTPLWTDMPWDKPSLNVLQEVQVKRSDVVSFHSYSGVDELKSLIDALKTYGKPVVCSEYMAREAGSYFDPHMGVMKDSGVDAFNWGLVSGLTQTIYPWSSLNDPNPYEGVDDPNPWFHDILHANGTAKYSDEEKYIRSVTGAAASMQ